jgi:hypothetical protein
MAFPTGPSNGQIVTVNGVTYTYASATNSWKRVQAPIATPISANIVYANVFAYQSNSISILDGVTSAIVGANAAIVTANTALKNYADDQITTANTALKNYADDQITTANTALKNYADDQITTANTALKGYVDSANTIQSSQITTLQGLVYTNANVDAHLTSTGSGNITISSGAFSLPQTGPGATTVGGATAIPVITTDAYGRVTGLSTASVSSTLNIAGDTGTGSVSLTSQSLAIAAGAGITTSASGQTFTITNSGVTGLSSSGAGNLTVSASTGAVTLALPQTGPGAGTWGGASEGLVIPTIVTDAYGRITAASNTSVAITANIAGTSGSTGAIQQGQTFTFTTTNGMVLAASGNTLGISTPQAITTGSSPTFAGITLNGASQVNGTLGVTGVTSITNATASTGYGNGALVVTGGAGFGGTSYFGQDLYVTGNLYVPNLVATSTSTLSVTSPLLYLTGAPYPYNFDIGFYGHFIGGSANNYSHSGVVRNHNNDRWVFFSNIASEPSSTTVNFADAGTIYDTVQAGALLLSNTTPSTSTTSGALVVTGGAGINGNLNVNSAGYFGYNAANTPLTNPSIVGTSSSQAVDAGQYYVQSALINTNATGSADIVAYPNNTTDGITGFMDMGFTGNLFSDPAYTITKANDGYLFASARDGSALGGNLVLATDKTGTYNDIVIATGSFFANAEVARFHGNVSSDGKLGISYTTNSTSTTTGAVTIAGGLGVAGNVYAGEIYTSGLRWASNSAVIQTGGGGNYVVSTTAPSSPTIGDKWFNSTTDVLYEYQDVGTGTFWIDVSGTVITSGNVTVAGSDSISPFLLMGA